MQDSWNESDGLLLRSLRERTGVDRSLFARACSISVAQLTELEDGGHGRFYTDRIKTHVGRGLLKRLGHVHAPPPEVAAPSPADPDDAPAAAPAVSPAAAEAARVLPVEPAPLAPITSPSRTAVKAPAYIAWVRAGVLTAVAVTLVVIMIPRKPRESKVPVEDPAAQASARPPAASAAPAASVASLALAVPGISEAAASTVAPDPQVQPNTPATTVQVSATERRCDLPPREKVAQFTPPNALRSNNYVYLESLKEASVCIVDSQNRQTVSALKPGEGVSVYGTPPFTVQTRQWADLRMFFQGVRVTLDSATPPLAVMLNPI